MNNSHLQRIGKIVSKELSRSYETLSAIKDGINYYWNRSDPNNVNTRNSFKNLNNFKNDYRKELSKIKQLEDTQREIRKILRK